MKVLLLVYTKTLNTMKIANMLSDEFSYFSTVDILKYPNTNINIDEYDLIGIGYPVFYSAMDGKCIKWIKSFGIKNKKYFIFKTFSSPAALNNASSVQIKRKLKKNSNKFLGEYSVLMPSFDREKYPLEMIGQMMHYNERYVKYICLKVANNKRDIIIPSMKDKCASHFTKLNIFKRISYTNKKNTLECFKLEEIKNYYDSKYINRDSRGFYMHFVNYYAKLENLLQNNNL